MDDLIIPVIIAISVYIIADRLGEWKKRRMYSRLGVAVLHPVLEEVRTGIRLMEVLDEAAKNRAGNLPAGLLPVQRMGSTSGFPPRECYLTTKGATLSFEALKLFLNEKALEWLN